MISKKLSICALSLCVVGLTACGNAQKPGAQIASDTHYSANQNNENVTRMPSYDGGVGHEFPRVTTNSLGNKTNGQGTSVYSTIGSSSLHSEGLSSYLESRLSGEGIHGIRVLVMDDTVFLGQAKKQISSARYDEMQNKVLNGTKGTSAIGPSTTTKSTGTPGSKNVNFENLSESRSLMKQLLGETTHVLAVTNPEAVKAIERVKKNMAQLTPASQPMILKDITLILNQSFVENK